MNENRSICYEKSLEYWADIPPTIDGVLGGFGYISQVDVQGSTLFLKALFSSRNPPSTQTALDCGAGIGRITKHVLIPHFNKVDVIEPDEKFIKEIPEFVGPMKIKLGSLYKLGLQEFIPDKKYDVIWNQWVLGYLTDDDLVSYLIRCKNALAENGVVVIKENVTTSGNVEKDEVDSSVTRSLKQYLKLFKTAHLKRIKQSKQTNFPNGIYPVYMFALVPIPEDQTVTIQEISEGSLENPLSTVL
ncbi:N-terminal Xaa-Pro-Lys N-methyltransferase 1-A-like [Plodia interpunctella]|uniref:N-terminal Xaa-Pro-Lys N-methyltransferase 1-A-like n=1 Tax=Plodia interpunctella TaxID=58824 RepID=UPI002368AF4E|nr:N-terminal Xaa-Pro-Lys N-methyltransferase 1-A-like [Plodia interpunctella]